MLCGCSFIGSAPPATYDLQAPAIAKSQGWGTVFIIGIGFNLLAALLALVALKPMRMRHFAAASQTAEAAATGRSPVSRTRMTSDSAPG